MDTRTFEMFRDLIEKESGIHLTDEKRQLLSNRIQKRLRALKLSQPQEYLRIIELDASQEELVNLIDVVSTNVTYFWREEKHFLTFANILKEYKEQGRNKIRVWCAASSSGEEPYTLAFTYLETFGKARCDFKILATDICTPVLRKAVRGEFPPDQLSRLPEKYRSRWFQEQPTGTWRVDPELKDLILFKKLNLASFPYPIHGPLDVIFCRNVMIYFDTPLRQAIINQFSRLLAPGGYLFLSHAENLLRVDHQFKTHDVSVYRKPGG